MEPAITADEDATVEVGHATGIDGLSGAIVDDVEPLHGDLDGEPVSEGANISAHEGAAGGVAVAVGGLLLRFRTGGIAEEEESDPTDEESHAPAIETASAHEGQGQQPGGGEESATARPAFQHGERRDREALHAGDAVGERDALARE